MSDFIFFDRFHTSFPIVIRFLTSFPILFPVLPVIQNERKFMRDFLHLCFEENFGCKLVVFDVFYLLWLEMQDVILDDMKAYRTN